MERNKQQPHPLPGPHRRDDQDLMDEIIPLPKEPGDDDESDTRGSRGRH